MTFAALKALAAKLDTRKYQGLGQRVAVILDSANDNAFDTVHVEKAATATDLDAIALGTLSSILAYSTDKAAVAWFTRHGISF